MSKQFDTVAAASQETARQFTEGTRIGTYHVVQAIFHIAGQLAIANDREAEFAKAFAEGTEGVSNA